MCKTKPKNVYIMSGRTAKVVCSYRFSGTQCVTNHDPQSFHAAARVMPRRCVATAKAGRAHRFSGSFQLELFSSSASSPCFLSSFLLGPFHSQPFHLWSLHQFQLCNPILGNLHS